MSIITEQLSTIEECDQVLEWLNDQLDAVSFEKTGDERDEKKMSKTSTEMVTDMKEVESNIAVLTTVVGGLPEGDLKRKKTVELSAANNRKVALTERMRNYGPVSLVKKDTEVDLGVSAIQVYNTKIADVTARKAAIGG